MELKKIVSLANKTSELRFLAMVRSLRQTGCDLPVWVIPYDDNRFDLPDNCIWWEMDEVTQLLNANHHHSLKRKFQCFLTDNYQYIDADVIFLKNPVLELKDLYGFVTSCCHWNNPEHTFVSSTMDLFRKRSTTWQRNVFNSGQFACDRKLFTMDRLQQLVHDPVNIHALVTHDQVAINLFVFLSGIKITNVTLPPYNVESTWAGDYLDAGYERYWTDESKKPYLIHWAGCRMDTGRPIDQLFLKYLTPAEKQEWNSKVTSLRNLSNPSKLRRMFSGLKKRLS